MMAEFAKTFPEVKKVLIDERDQFLASLNNQCPGKKSWLWLVQVMW